MSRLWDRINIRAERVEVADQSSISIFFHSKRQVQASVTNASENANASSKLMTESFDCGRDAVYGPSVTKT